MVAPIKLTALRNLTPTRGRGGMGQFYGCRVWRAAMEQLETPLDTGTYGTVGTANFDVVVPEPGSLALIGMIGLGLIRRNRFTM